MPMLMPLLPAPDGFLEGNSVVVVAADESELSHPPPSDDDDTTADVVFWEDEVDGVISSCPLRACTEGTWGSGVVCSFQEAVAYTPMFTGDMSTYRGLMIE